MMGRKVGVRVQQQSQCDDRHSNGKVESVGRSKKLPSLMWVSLVKVEVERKSKDEKPGKARA